MGTKIDDLLTERSDLKVRAQEIIDAIDGVPSEEQSEKLKELDEQYQARSSDLQAAQAVDDAAARFREGEEEDVKLRSAQTPGIYGGAGAEEDELATPGELFVRSSQYENWMKRHPSGGPSQGSDVSDTLDVGAYRTFLGIRNATEKLRAGVLTPSKYRALVTSADASAGQLVRPEYRGLLEPGLVRPLTIRDLVTTIPVTTDAIEYVKELTRVTNAAPVAEATSATGSSGLKPEGGLTFGLVSDTVKTIAEWVPATRRILSDAPQLRTYIDGYLTDDIALELEDQMVAGDGTGENFTGLLNTVGIQTAGPPAGVVNMLDLIRTAKRLIRINARTNASAVLMNPVDSETADLLKFGGATPTAYIGGGPYGADIGGTIWGLRKIESEAIPAGTALVGDFRRAILFDREAVNISVGTINDDFVRNIVRVLAEMRAGFGVLRPKAFVAVDVTP